MKSLNFSKINKLLLQLLNNLTGEKLTMKEYLKKTAEKYKKRKNNF